jgi:hypothetical protein
MMVLHNITLITAPGAGRGFHFLALSSAQSTSFKSYRTMRGRR